MKLRPRSKRASADPGGAPQGAGVPVSGDTASLPPVGAPFAPPAPYLGTGYRDGDSLPDGAPEAGNIAVQEAADSMAAAVSVVAAVNLLPHTYAERAAVHRAKFFAICAILFAVVLGVLLWLVAWQNAVTAQERLDEATATRALLQAEAARYADVPKVFQAVDTAQAQMQIAMGNEVRWSFFLNDLALIIPDGVALDSMTATSLAPGAVPAVPKAASGAAAPTDAAANFGNWTTSGKAFTYNDVAKWLDIQSRTPTLANPTVGGLTRAAEQNKTVVTFSSTAGLTAEALSGRYSEQEPEQ